MTARVPQIAGRTPANTNGPKLALKRVGDGRAVYRALAHVIVRRELISMGILNDSDRCDETRAAG
jgi:hypothetical protein